MSHRAGRMAGAALMLALAILAVSCSPEMGSEAWCMRMEKTPKGDWSANEAADYAKHCEFR